MAMLTEERGRKLQICRQWAAVEGVDKVIEERNVDAIVGPCNSFFAGIGVGARAYFSSILHRNLSLMIFTEYPLAVE
jgi:amidase